MRSVVLSGIIGLALVTVVVSGCTGQPAASPSGTDETSPATASPTASASTPADPTGEDAAVECLIAGSPWTLSNDELAEQIPGVLSGIPVTDVSVDGTQTLTVDEDLAATMSTDLTVTVLADLGDGLDMEVVQHQSGDASGTWVAADEGLLRAESAWDSDFDATTTVTVDGVESPETVPLAAPDIAASTTTEIDCDGESLTVRTMGSPIALPFVS